MRGSVAEGRSNVNSYKGETGSKGGGGYTLKPSNHGERGSANSARRAGAQSSELRLGKLQVVVWLGLALGSIVGAYFVGFFSGRYVGFESARESSAGEVAKLPVPDTFQGRIAQNPGNVYDKLKAPAVLREPEASSGERSQGSQPKNVPQILGSDVGQPAKAGEVAGRQLGAAQQEISDSPLENSAAGNDFAGLVAEVEESSSGPQIIIGADEGLAGGKLPDSVRMLGGADESKASSDKSAVRAIVDSSDSKEAVVAKTTKSADALLDERIANARSDASKSAQVSSKLESKDAGPLVRKVVPSGYFAQVAAPKKLGEAEAIAKKLKRSGFPVVVESASVEGQSFYRVLVGPEQNKAQADILVSQLKSESYLSGAPFIRKFK